MCYVNKKLWFVIRVTVGEYAFPLMEFVGLSGHDTIASPKDAPDFVRIPYYRYYLLFVRG